MSRSVWKTSRNVSVKFPYWFGTKIQKCSVTCPISISVGWGMPRHRPFLSASAGACPGTVHFYQRRLGHAPASWNCRVCAIHHGSRWLEPLMFYLFYVLQLVHIMDAPETKQWRQLRLHVVTCKSTHQLRRIKACEKCGCAEFESKFNSWSKRLPLDPGLHGSHRIPVAE